MSADFGADFEADFEKLQSDNEELRTRLEHLESLVNELKNGGSKKVKSKTEVKKKPTKKTLKEIVASWEEGKSIGLCPRYVASSSNEADHDYCGQQIVGFHDKEDKFIQYEHDKREKDEDFLIGIEEFCRSRCDKCINKGMAPTSKHTKNIIQAVKGSPTKIKEQKRNLGAVVTSISLPETVSTPSPDDGEKIVVGDFIDQIIDVENLRVVLRRVKNKNGTPRKGRLPRILGCYYNDVDYEYDGENLDGLCRLPGESIRKVGNCKDESKDLPELEERGDGEEEAKAEPDKPKPKPKLKVSSPEDDEDKDDTESGSEDDLTEDLLRKFKL